MKRLSPYTEPYGSQKWTWVSLYSTSPWEKNWWVHGEFTVTKMVTASRDWAVTWAVMELWPSRDWAVIAVIELWPRRDWAVT